jgi:hypothetical protein
MADAVTPAAVCAGGIPCIAFMSAIGMDPVNMVAGLAGVVVVQTFLPSQDEPKELRKIALFGTASMIVAAWGGPVIAVGVVGAMPDAWQWIKGLPADHVRAVSAGIAGGFAQPLMLWLRSLMPKRAAPPLKE